MLLWYLLAVNLVAATLFISDKLFAASGRRVPELLLHVLEAAGGALTVLPLIFVIRHKSRKPSYWLWTAAFTACWLMVLSHYVLK